MARPRQFDEMTVLGAAVECFWSKGFATTSVRELAKQMGMSSPSLYNAFGDKRALYRRALAHYTAQSFRERAWSLEATLPPRQAISAFFADVIAASLTDKERKGCMVVNSALEGVPRDRRFQRLVADILIEVEEFFRRTVEAGQRAGTISSARSASDLARLLLGVLLGMRVLARARPERELLEGMLRPALTLLDDSSPADSSAAATARMA